MKKILGTLLLALLMVGCGPSKRIRTTITYRVYWTDSNVKEYTVERDGVIRYGCRDGHNYLYSRADEDYIVETTAPIEIISKEEKELP